jgi:hypothetical protein
MGGGEGVGGKAKLGEAELCLKQIRELLNQTEHLKINFLCPLIVNATNDSLYLKTDISKYEHIHLYVT